MDDLCLVCGASWDCEHGPTLEERGMEYIAPDGPSFRELHGPHANDGSAVRPDGLSLVDRLAAAVPDPPDRVPPALPVGFDPDQFVQVVTDAVTKVGDLLQSLPSLMMQAMNSVADGLQRVNEIVASWPETLWQLRFRDEHARCCGCSNSHAPTYLWAVPLAPAPGISVEEAAQALRAVARGPPKDERIMRRRGVQTVR